MGPVAVSSGRQALLRQRNPVDPRLVLTAPLRTRRAITTASCVVCPWPDEVSDYYAASSITVSIYMRQAGYVVLCLVKYPHYVVVPGRGTRLTRAIPSPIIFPIGFLSNYRLRAT